MNSQKSLIHGAFISLLSLVLSVPLISLAQTNSYEGSEAALLTPWSAFNRSLLHLARPRKIFQEKPQNVTWHIDQFDPSFGGFQWVANAQFTATSPSKNQIDFETKNLQIKVQVSDISIDQVIDQAIGGGILHVRLKGQCGPVSLSQKSSRVHALFSYKVENNKIVTHLDQFEISWAPQTWKVSNISCAGPTGFAEAITKKITERLQTADDIRPLVEQKVAAELQSEINTVVEKLQAPRALPLPAKVHPVALNFSGFDSTGDFLITKGQFIWDQKNPSPNVRPLDLSTLPKNLSATETTLLLPTAALNDFLNVQLQEEPKWAHLDLSKQPLFQELLQNRFLLFFKWPDLLNYSSESPFNLAISRPSKISLSWSNSGMATAPLNLQGWLQSVRQGTWWNYVLLKTQGQATLSPKIQDGSFSVVIKTNAENVKAEYGALYAKTFEPSSDIPDELAPALLNAQFAKFTETLRLPDLDLGILGKARAQSFKVIQKDLLVVPFRVIQN